MEGILEPLLSEVAMIAPLQQMYEVIKSKISKTDPGLWERGFGRYRQLHLFYFFLIESQCESSAGPPEVSKEIFIQQGVPARLRLTKSISTIQEFADAFNCRSTDDMSGTRKFNCSIYEARRHHEVSGILFK
ncbi:uncharacterized protein LOC144118699 [Amblyomma americanum]